MLTRALSLISLVIALYFLYLGYIGHHNEVSNAVPFIIISVILYIFAEQINWFFYKKKAPKLAKPLLKLLRARDSFYNSLDNIDKKKFEDRVSLFIISHDFTPQGLERLPEDVKLIIASRVVRLTFKSEDYLYDDYEKIIVYKDAFLSPSFRENFHSSELFTRDKCTLFSMKHLFASFMEPYKYYDIALHEFSKIWRTKNIDIDIKYSNEKIWRKLKHHPKYTFDKVSAAIGLDQEDPFPVLVNLFYYDNDFLRENFPIIFKELNSKLY